MFKIIKSNILLVVLGHSLTAKHHFHIFILYSKEYNVGEITIKFSVVEIFKRKNVTFFIALKTLFFYFRRIKNIPAICISVPSYLIESKFDLLLKYFMCQKQLFLFPYLNLVFHLRYYSELNAYTGFDHCLNKVPNKTIVDYMSSQLLKLTWQ